MNTQLCQCASNWKKEFIRYYCFYAILKTVLIVFFYTSVYQKRIFNIYKYADIILFITFVIITVTYINELRKKKCLCSDNWKRKLTLVYAWIGVGMSGLLLVSATIFIFIILGISYFTYNQKNSDYICGHSFKEPIEENSNGLSKYPKCSILGTSLDLGWESVFLNS